MNVKLRSFIFLSLMCAFTLHSQNQSQLVYLDQGKLSYAPFAMTGQSNQVNTIPDFSYAGYMGGGVAIPSDIPIKATVHPEVGDDAPRIQEAIDQVSALDPDQNGFRGVVLLKAGHYSLEDFILIRQSGVVLRGEGQGLNGSVLHANPRVNHSIISILGSGSTTRDFETTQSITTSYVPVGVRSFDITDASQYAIGDYIVVTRTPNQTWIDELGMDQEPLCQGKSGCVGWEPGSYAIGHERVITDISDNTITVNIPIVDVIEDAYGGGTVTKVVSSRRISNCAIENIRIQSFYDANSDEAHAWTAVRITDAENCWIRQVTGQYLAYSTVNIDDANFITVQDCAYIDPKSNVTGGRRYSFAIQEGIGNLFQRCYAVSGRHDFVTGSRVTGPNVFLDGLAEKVNSDIGPHHRWATGTLFDNIRGGSTRVWNRGNSGSGHGWSGAQTMFWNIDSYSGEFRVDSPLGAMNWGIGCVGTNQNGEGFWESWGGHVQPRSLYLQQLEDRLGPNAVANITIPEQESSEIYDLLASWAGQGNFADGGFTGEPPSIQFVSPDNTIDVSIWEGGDIEVDATDSDGVVLSVKLLINGEPLAVIDEAPFVFSNATAAIQGLSHQVHYLQAIATDDDGNTSTTRVKIIGGDPPLMVEEMEEEEEEEMRSEINIFPNPAQQGKLTIEMIKTGTYSVRLFDLYGRQIQQSKFEGIDHLFTANTVNEGVYIIEIQENNETLLKSKVIIVN